MEKMEGNANWEHLTQRARRVLSAAQDEARRFNHNYIGTEHLLLGLMHDTQGVAASVLADAAVERTAIRSAVEFIIGRGERPVVGEIGLTPRAKKVIQLARDEARRLGHQETGTAHLLLGLIREGEGIAAGILESRGMSLARLRERTLRAVSEGRHDPEIAETENWGGREEAVAGLAPGDRSWRPARMGGWSYLLLFASWEGDAPTVVRALGQHGQGVESGPLTDVLNTLGAQGWELEAVDPSGPDGSLYILKRRSPAGVE